MRAARNQLRLAGSHRVGLKGWVVNYYRNDLTNNDRFFEHLIEAGVLPRLGTCFESGAYDGEVSSSTFILEKKYGWRGVLAEPIRGMEPRIAEKRPLAKPVPFAVTGRDGDIVEFIETDNYGYSGVKRQLEWRSEVMRARGPGWVDQWQMEPTRTYSVETISLNTTFERYNDGQAPTVCCLDMEGSELDALATFDFGRFGPLMFTIEGPLCTELVIRNGYVNVRNPFNIKASYEFYFVKEQLYGDHRGEFEAR
jgi:hypothetical protein